MALSGFGRGRGEDGEMDGGVPAPAPGNLTAFIDQGSHFEGKLSFKDTVRIDGSFEGEIASENTLIVGASGEIEANIRSTVVVVSGSVIGDITATHQVVLHKTARVEGNIQAPSLVMEEGACLNGTLIMETAGGKAKSQAPLKAVPGGASPSKVSGNGPAKDDKAPPAKED